MDELLPPPAAGRQFATRVRPGFADCAPAGRVRLDGLARWLQDVAYADVADAGLHEAAVWVLRRSRMRVARFPRFAEGPLEAVTWCSGLGTMWAERRTRIGSDVEAVALWVHLDRETWRPCPLGPAELEAYGTAGGGRRVRARLRHPPPPAEPERRRTWMFRTAEMDLAGHVNNAAYWVPIEEELLAGAVEAESIDAEIEFRGPAQPGEKEILAAGGMRWISADGQVHASIALRESLTP